MKLQLFQTSEIFYGFLIVIKNLLIFYSKFLTERFLKQKYICILNKMAKSEEDMEESEDKEEDKEEDSDSGSDW